MGDDTKDKDNEIQGSDVTSTDETKAPQKDKLKEGLGLLMEATTEGIAKTKDNASKKLEEIDTGKVRQETATKLKSLEFKINWGGWDTGEKIIFVSAVIAFLSFFLPWVDVGIATKNGFSTLYCLLFVCFVYPLLQTLQAKALNKAIAFGCSATSVVLTMILFVHHQEELFGTVVNISGAGLFLFFIASVTLGLGAYKTGRI